MAGFLGKHDAKYNNVTVQANRIIKKIQEWLLNIHSAKSFKVQMWEGDLQIAHTWQIQFSAPRIGRSVVVTWKKPPAGFIKLNSDGVLNHRTGKAAAGGLIRDEDGRII